MESSPLVSVSPHGLNHFIVPTRTILRKLNMFLRLPMSSLHIVPSRPLSDRADRHFWVRSRYFCASFCSHGCEGGGGGKEGKGGGGGGGAERRNQMRGNFMGRSLAGNRGDFHLWL